MMAKRCGYHEHDPAPAREPPGPDDRAAKEDQARCEQQHPDQGGREERDAVDVVLQGDRRRGLAREVHAPDRRLRERRGAEDRGRDGVADDRCHKSPEREAARSAADEEHEERGEADVADRRTEDARGEMAHQEPGRGGEGRVPREIGLGRRLMVEGAEEEQNCPYRQGPDEETCVPVDPFGYRPVRQRRAILVDVLVRGDREELLEVV